MSTSEDKQILDGLEPSVCNESIFVEPMRWMGPKVRCHVKIQEGTFFPSLPARQVDYVVFCCDAESVLRVQHMNLANITYTDYLAASHCT